ncbi:MAG TPA: DNA mismatch repair protein MutT [Clostridiales bacterium]|nr:MAG: DNA mismatch repair protein MutT [Clostridiales bacterium GWD2_32_19]HCC06611.1 DNA mismatch repair protein MutT [Clostridiales bacterium]
MNEHPKVGLGVFVIKEGKILMGKRKSPHGEGTWGLPGGHLEMFETWEECSRREVLEETGVMIKSIKFGTVTNDIFENESKHYITIFMLSEYCDGEVEILEPDKFEEWKWMDWDEFPDNLFLPLINLRKIDFNPLT